MPALMLVQGERLAYRFIEFLTAAEEPQYI